MAHPSGDIMISPSRIMLNLSYKVFFLDERASLSTYPGQSVIVSDFIDIYQACELVNLLHTPFPSHTRQ